MEADRQIIATSFDKDRNIFFSINAYLSYIANIFNKEKAKICFIGVANDDSLLERLFFKACIYVTYPKWEVCTLTTTDLMDDVKTNIIYTCDLIFVGGGKTTTLILVFNDTGFDKKLKEAYNKGIIMGGVSAGLLCWFQHGITDSYEQLSVLKCLNFLPFSTTPHYQIEERGQLFNILVSDGELAPGYGVPDGAIVHFINEKLVHTTNSSDIVEWISK